jgi:hypothetical protein
MLIFLPCLSILKSISINGHMQKMRALKSPMLAPVSKKNEVLIKGIRRQSVFRKLFVYENGCVFFFERDYGPPVKRYVG